VTGRAVLKSLDPIFPAKDSRYLCLSHEELG
jgi:hypothetical protein